MPEDFNIRNIAEIGFSDSPIIENDLELFMQELDILFSTDKNEMFGDCGIGLNLEKYLWKTKVSANVIKNEIISQIQANCLMNEYFEWSVEVDIAKGTVRDIGYINIIVKKKNSGNAKPEVLKFIYK